jgi:hypothetical protein
MRKRVMFPMVEGDLGDSYIVLWHRRSLERGGEARNCPGLLDDGRSCLVVGRRGFQAFMWSAALIGRVV